MVGFSLNPVNWITSAAGAVVGTAGGAVIDAIVGWIEGGLHYIANELAVSLAELSEGSFGDKALELGGQAKWVALVLVVGSTMLSAAGALLNRDGSIGDTVKEIPITLALLAMWWFAATTVAAAMAQLTAWFLGDALFDALRGGLVVDVGVNSFVRAIVAVLMIVFLLIFYIELLVLNHLVTLGVIVGQVAIGLRPSRGTRGVSGQMVRNLAALACGPPLATLSLSLTVGRASPDMGTLLPSLTALAGLVVSVLAPMLASRFLPLGGEGSNPTRGMLGAAAQIAGSVAAGAVAGGVAGGKAAGGGQAAYAVSGPSAGGAAGGAPPGGPPDGGGSGGGGGSLPGAPSIATLASAATSDPAPGGGEPAASPTSSASTSTSTAGGSVARPTPRRVSSDAAQRAPARALAASAAVAELARTGDRQ